MATRVAQPTLLQGAVVSGAGRGKRLGFPTANVKLEPPTAHAPEGIFAAWTSINGSLRVPAVVHIGPRPTFNDATVTTEVHLLEAPAQPLLGCRVTIELAYYIRGVKKFATSRELVAAIARDCEQTRSLLELAP